MKSLIINNIEVANGRVVKALKLMLDNGTDEQLRELNCYKYDEQFYKLESEWLPFYYMVKKEFNCLIVWTTSTPTSFNGGDDVVQRLYKPLCLIQQPETNWGDTIIYDIARDVVNGLIRGQWLQAKEFIAPLADE